MNIGIVTTWFSRGAAYVSRAYRDILSREFNVFIFARGGESYAIGDTEWDGPRVYWAKRFTGDWTRIDICEFAYWLDKNKIDLVLFNEQRDWEIVARLVPTNVKTVAYVDYYTEETVEFFNLYDGLICNTKRHYSVFKDKHPNVIYIPWGTDISKFCSFSLDFTRGERIVFFHSAGMGGINFRKGTDLVVEAFERVKGDCLLIIHSQIPLHKYGNIGEKIKGNEKILFINGTIEQPGLFFLGDVYVYPTKLEGIGLTIVEALACGLPVITTDCPPMNEFVKDNVTGKLVRVKKYTKRFDEYYWPEATVDLEHLVESMQYFVTNSHELKDWKRRARLYAVDERNWFKNALELPLWFKELKKRKMSPSRKVLMEKSIRFSNLFRGKSDYELLRFGYETTKGFMKRLLGFKWWLKQRQGI